MYYHMLEDGREVPSQQSRSGQKRCLSAKLVS